MPTGPRWSRASCSVRIGVLVSVTEGRTHQIDQTLKFVPRAPLILRALCEPLMPPVEDELFGLAERRSH